MTETKSNVASLPGSPSDLSLSPSHLLSSCSLFTAYLLKEKKKWTKTNHVAAMSSVFALGERIKLCQRQIGAKLFDFLRCLGQKNQPLLPKEHCQDRLSFTLALYFHQALVLTMGKGFQSGLWCEIPYFTNHSLIIKSR